MGGWQISKVWNSNGRWGCYFDPQGIHHYMFRHETSPVWPSKRCHYRKLYGWCYYDPQGIHHYIYFITRHVLCELQKYFQKLYRRCCSDSQSIHHYIFLHAISLVWPSRRYHYRKLYGWSHFDPIGIQHYIFHHATSLVWPLIRCHCCKHFIILKMSTEYTLEPENTRAMQNVSFIICAFLSDCRAGDQKPHKLIYTSFHWLLGILWVGYPQDSEEIDLFVNYSQDIKTMSRFFLITP